VSRRTCISAGPGIKYLPLPADSDEGNSVFRSDVDKDQSSAKLAVSW
jgi:hypothetical protein